jgi:hypothetical protein
VIPVVDDELVDGAFDDAYRAGEELGPFEVGERLGWGEVDEVVGPLAHDLVVPNGPRCSSNDAELAVAYFVAMAIGAVQDVACPPLG